MSQNNINIIPKQIILYGGTGQAKVVNPIIESLGSKVIAVIDDTPNLSSPIHNVSIYKGYNEFEKEFNKSKNLEKPGFLVTIGNNKNSRNAKARVKLSEFLKEKGFIPISIAHGTAFVSSSAEIGIGAQIMNRSTIMPEVKIGNYCIINTNCSIDHECILEDGVEVDPGATLCGLVHVEKYAWIAAGAVILPRIRIGEGATIGAGAVVTKDVAPYTLVTGVPARLKSLIDKN